MYNTPIWVTIGGWSITLLVAVIPALIAWSKSGHLQKDQDNLVSRQDSAEKEIKRISKLQKASVENSHFLNAKQHLVKNLKSDIRNLKKDLLGSVTLLNVRLHVVEIQSYSSTWEKEDCDKINGLLSYIQKWSLDTTGQEEHRDEIITNCTMGLQDVLIIIEKGRYETL